MQFSVTFRHMDTSEAVKEYAREKVDKVKKYFPDPIMVHVVLSTERGYQHQADINIQLHNGLLIKGTEVTEDMYSSIDLVMAKIERQLRRYKEKITHHKARADLSELPVAYHVFEEEAFGDGSGNGKAAKAIPAPKIAKTQTIPARFMSVEEAVMQMNLLGMQFMAFRNSTSGLVNVVYRQEDGTYGLIETGAPV